MIDNVCRKVIVIVLYLLTLFIIVTDSDCNVYVEKI